MACIRIHLTAALVAATIVSGGAGAQAQSTMAPTKSTPATSAPSTPKTSTAAEVEAWTTKQWQAAKKTWAKDETKWSDCRSQSGKQKLAGRKSWSFLYACMAG